MKLDHNGNGGLPCIHIWAPRLVNGNQSPDSNPNHFIPVDSYRI